MNKTVENSSGKEDRREGERYVYKVIHEMDSYEVEYWDTVENKELEPEAICKLLNTCIETPEVVEFVSEVFKIRVRKGPSYVLVSVPEFTRINEHIQKLEDKLAQAKEGERIANSNAQQSSNLAYKYEKELAKLRRKNESTSNG